MSISQNFPATWPSLVLDFANSKTLDPRVTFTRASTGTYVGSDGLIKTAAADEARFDHDPATGESLGLLIEESRTNLQPYSIVSDGPQGWPTSQAVTFSIPTDVSAPDGSISDNRKMIAIATNSFHSTFKQINSGSNGQVHTFSVYMKSAGSDYGYIYVDTIGGTYGGVAVQFSTGNTAIMAADGIGTQVATSVVPAADGWYRLSVSGSFSTTNNHYCHINVGNDLAFSQFTGDGTNGIYVWGAQLEVGSFPTSYIPTNGSTVVRAGDLASISGTNFAEWYNPTEGSLYSNFILNGLDGAYNNTSVMINNNTENEYIAIFGHDPAYAWVQSSGGTSFGPPLGSSTVTGTNYKVAMAYKLNDFAATLNGGSVSTDTNGAVPTVDRMFIGRRSAFDKPLHGTIEKLTYYPKRLTNVQLQALTK